MQLTEYCLQGTLAHAFFSKIKHALGNSEEGKEVCILKQFSNTNLLNVSDKGYSESM